MSAAPLTTSALTRALNSATATALTRVVVLSLPVLCTVGLWAGHRYLAEQVEAAPVVVELRDAQAKTAAALAAQAERIRELEEGRRAAAAGQTDVLYQLKRLDAKADSTSQLLNRLVGAFEARGIVPRQQTLERQEVAP